MQDLTIKKALTLAPKLPRLDREVLLAHVLGKDRVFLIAHSETKLTSNQLKHYQSFLTRATAHEPIAYIVGTKEFYGRNFLVNQNTLIPRPETEIMIEHILQSIKESAHKYKNEKKIAIVDIGTGSGCIIVSLAKELESSADHRRSNIELFATDISSRALREAQKNAQYHDTKKGITFMKSDLLSRLLKQLSRSAEIFVVANLPYLSAALYRSAPLSVKRYEPKSALVSGADGLDHYRRLMTELRAINRTGIKINFFLEISPDQTKNIPALFTDITTLSSLAIIPDLAGKARLVIGVIDVSQNKSPAIAGLL
jgi:release factor glutamine methyltransferase